MGRTRVFYGHEGVVPPLGLRASVAAPPAPEVDDEEIVDDTELHADSSSIDEAGEQTDDGTAVIETIPGTEDGEPVEIEAEPIDLPTSRDKVKVIDAFIAEQREKGAVIEVAEDATKPEKLDAIAAWAETIPALSDNTDTKE